VWCWNHFDSHQLRETAQAPPEADAFRSRLGRGMGDVAAVRYFAAGGARKFVELCQHVELFQEYQKKLEILRITG